MECIIVWNDTGRQSLMIPATGKYGIQNKCNHILVRINISKGSERSFQVIFREPHLLANFPFCVRVGQLGPVTSSWQHLSERASQVVWVSRRAWEPYTSQSLKPASLQQGDQRALRSKNPDPRAQADREGLRS